MKLSGWENSNRIQFTIPKERVGVFTEVVPILFRLSSTTGNSKTDLTTVFDYMSVAGSSYANRKKVAFSQLVDGIEQRLYAELDMWDHVTEKALFWVRPLELSLEYENIFYFYYDKTKESDLYYISEAGDLAITPFINIGANATYDIYGGRPLALIKKEDKYLFWYVLSSPSGGYWHGIIYYCESVDLVTFSNFVVCVDTTPVETRYYKSGGEIIYQNGIYKMWYSGNNYTNSSYYHVIYYCTSVDGKVWENFTPCTGLVVSGSSGSALSQDGPSVIFEDGLYKMWFTGVSTSTYISSVFYAESLDGINYVNIQRLFGEDNISIVVSTLKLYRVKRIAALYHIWFSAIEIGTGKTTLYYLKSIDGKIWTDLVLFSEYGLEGTYDLTNISGMLVFEEVPNLYTLLYTGLLDSFYCILKVDSVFLAHPMAPSQLVWDDKFTSVHHFNPSFGYTNSVSMNAPVKTLSNISSTSDNLGSYAIKFNSLTSYVDMGNHTNYNYGTTSQVLLFGTVDGGNILYSKGLYSDCTTMLYRQQTPLLTRSSFNDTFSGTVGSVPDPYLWTVTYGNPTQNAGSLKFSQALNEKVRSIFYVGGHNTEVSFDFFIEGGNLTVGWMLALRIGFFNNTQDYLLQVVRPSTSNVYLQGVKKDTYEGQFGYSPTVPPVDYFSGKLRFRLVNTSLIFSYYYQGAWLDVANFALPASSYTYGYIEFNKTQLTSSDLTIFYISNFTTNFNNTFFIRNSTSSNVLSLEYRKDNITHFLELPNFTYNSTWTSYSFSTASEISNLNTSVAESNHGFMYCTSSGVQTNGHSVILGSSLSGITGKISEMFCFKNQASQDTLNLMTLNLKDDLINISRYYLRGHTTKYNQAFSTTVLVYDQDTGDLLSSTISSSADGFYFAEVPFKDNYFIVGLGDTLYNNFILSDITPQILF